MSSSAQRKRRTTGTPLVSSPSMKTSKMAQSNRATNSRRAANRAAASNRATRETTAANTTANETANISSMPNEPDLPTETINVMDNRTENDVVVVDLTCEGSESAVVDLTNNDSVLVIDEGVQQSQGPNAESYVVSSDEDDVTPNVISAAVMSSYHKSRSTPGTISCPVCLDTYTEIVDSGRLVVSTKCGHVFCSQCLRDALSSSHTCPTCRKKLTNRQYHPLYV
ncbi:E3 ubiquitin-protein ligase RNF4 isoform X2 [Cynoglossus semilaevis]|uniref:Ring finger protein 4 n=2 Tax=Cynoglossus semilaevis TaxID=244447 RepID=A0A3P8V2Q8_CYNSE|nr:E3 ubiquitin-protein ligase RNF4 isoform X2 [Cynoglossus semilaevis]XP_008325017.1 E3 ubiquitin-protein ligase RNF4 isoform X2 [Cynoglossus semilaevis]XP_024918799.1 E3 ubiquitin-protein ligase RNF4 isoform X2 [Cynoglossus semilaevis]